MITSANRPAFSICTGGVSIATSSRLKTEGFFLPFGGKLSGDNRLIKLAELIPWDELEDGYPAQFLQRFGSSSKALSYGAMSVSHLAQRPGGSG